jgi:hypothetical protein
LTEADLAFEKEIQALLLEYSYSSGEEFSTTTNSLGIDPQDYLANFSDAVLLTIYANPLLIEYFSDNIQLLYCLESMKS